MIHLFKHDSNTAAGGAKMEMKESRENDDIRERGRDGERERESERERTE